MEIIPFSLYELVFIACSVFVAYSVKGVSGFGAGLLAIPLLVLILPLSLCVPAVSLLSYAGNITQATALRRHAAWRDLLPLAPFSLAGVAMAIWILTSVDPNQLALALGLFVLIYGVVTLLPSRQIEGSRLWAAPIGFSGGLIGALFGSGGFVYVVYLKLRRLEKSSFRSSVALTLFFDGTFRVGGYISAGLYNQQTLTLAAISVPVMLLALYVGHRVQLTISQHRFQQVVSVLLICCSALLIYKSLR